MTSTDTTGNKVKIFDQVQIPVDLTTDPYNKRGEIGKVININQLGDIEVIFSDDIIGIYSEGCVYVLD